MTYEQLVERGREVAKQIVDAYQNDRWREAECMTDRFDELCWLASTIFGVELSKFYLDTGYYIEDKPC